MSMNDFPKIQKPTRTAPKSINWTLPALTTMDIVLVY